MPKDVGKKRQERAKKSYEKVLRRRTAIRAETKKSQEKERLEMVTKRNHEPIRNGGGNEMEKAIAVDAEKLSRNLDALRQMKQEFVETDQKRKEYQEKMSNGELPNPVANADRVGETNIEDSNN